MSRGAIALPLLGVSVIHRYGPLGSRVKTGVGRHDVLAARGRTSGREF